jgi:hypothetical protein
MVLRYRSTIARASNIRQEIIELPNLRYLRLLLFKRGLEQKETKATKGHRDYSLRGHDLNNQPTFLLMLSQAERFGKRRLKGKPLCTHGHCVIA